MAPPNTSTPTEGGYQIVIRATLNQETKKTIEDIITKYKLSYQTGNLWRTRHSTNKTEPDTIIIYRSKK